MKSENIYIGDEKFKKFLEHYHCPTPLELVKLRFAGAICSPNTELRPTDVISSLWKDNQSPRLETKAEADLFFKFFMGLWDEMFALVAANQVVLPRFDSSVAIAEICNFRYELVELGFVEGFWGGKDNIEIPKFISEIVDSLSQMALLYKSLASKIKPEQNNKNVLDALVECDKTVNKSISFIISNYALPHIDDIRRTVN